MRKAKTGLEELFNLDGFGVSSSITLLIIFLVLFTVPFNAQKKKPRQTPREETPESAAQSSVMPTVVIQSLTSCTPADRNSVTVMQIGKATNGSPIFTVNKKTYRSLNKILPSIDSGKTVLTVKADPLMDFGTLAKIFYDIRKTGGCINIEASTNPNSPYVYYLPELTKNQPGRIIKPNPATLKIFISADRKIMLNRDDQGSLEDTSRLVNRLNEIFKLRADQGILREGSNEIETSLVIKPSRSVKFRDVIKLIDAVKQTAAFPISLEIDDLQP